MAINEMNEYVKRVNQGNITDILCGVGQRNLRKPNTVKLKNAIKNNNFNKAREIIDNIYGNGETLQGEIDEDNMISRKFCYYAAHKYIDKIEEYKKTHGLIKEKSQQQTLDDSYHEIFKGKKSILPKETKCSYGIGTCY